MSKGRPNPLGLFPSLRREEHHYGTTFSSPSAALSTSVVRATEWIRTRERLMAIDEPWCAREIADITERLHPLLLALAKQRASSVVFAVPDPDVDRIISVIASKMKPIEPQPVDRSDPAFDCVQALEQGVEP